MCGLTGIAGRGIYKGDLTLFQELMYLSAFRGKDSTGVAAIKTRDKYIKIVKDAVAPADFLTAYGGEKGFLNDTYYDIMMGHSRWATKGVVNRQNAHPFQTSKYVGAHNGTLVERRFLDLTGKKTDSELMFEEMNERGIVETLSSLSPASAWAVSIFDRVTGKLWLGRNAKRGLYVAFLRNADVMFWSSELTMLHFVENRDRDYGWYHFDCYKLTPGVLYEIDVAKIKNKCHNPWIAHTIKSTFQTVPEVPKTSANDDIDWGNVMGGHFDENDIEGQYVWDKDKNHYVPAFQKDRSSKISELLDEVDADIKESMRAEQEQKSLLI